MIEILKIKEKKDDIEKKIKDKNYKIEVLCQYKTAKNFIMAMTAIIIINFYTGYIINDFYDQIMISLNQLGSVTISDGTVIQSSEADFRDFNGESIQLFPNLIEENMLKNDLLILLKSLQILFFMGLAFFNYKTTDNTNSIAGFGMILTSLIFSAILFVNITYSLFNVEQISNGLLFQDALGICLLGMCLFFLLSLIDLPKVSVYYKEKINKLKIKDLVNDKKELEENFNKLVEKEKSLYKDKKTIFEGIEATNSGKLNNDEIIYIKSFIVNAHKKIEKKEKKEDIKKESFAQKKALEMTMLANEIFDIKDNNDIEIKNI